ncbi:MAG: lysophospholipid acyltransferase family protein [Marinicellaceae bacterium]
MIAIRFTLRLLFLLLSLFVVFPIIILTIFIALKINNRNLNKLAVKVWSRLLCFICGLSLTQKGVPLKDPAFMVANHVSWLDIPVIHSFKLAGFVAKEEISRWPFLGWAIKSGETLFIKRGKHESRKLVLKTIEDRLKQNRSIAVFPEGKATNGDKLSRFHRQLMHAAVETQTPIQAVAIKYINKDGTRNKKVCFMGEEKFIINVFRIISLPTCHVEITFCEPIQTQDKSARQVALLTHHQVANILVKNDYL